MTTRRSLGLGLLAGAALAACGQQKPAGPKMAAKPGSLEWAAAGAWRIDPERDGARHPIQTLNFFGLKPNMDVVEVLPGRGWYTAILAPYLAAGGGTLTCASFNPVGASDSQLATLAEFKQRFLKNPKLFGAIGLTTLSPKTNQIAPPASADMVLAMLNVHSLLAEDYAHQAFRQFAAALKPGGILGIEEYRARAAGGVQDPEAGTGYVQEQFVKMLAEEAGLKFAGSTEINANPKDTKDHPFGVWTLPPYLYTAPIGAPPNPNFDNAKYRAIGEADRMTLKFVKPMDAAEPESIAP
jgi:predicted methyltransferase